MTDPKGWDISRLKEWLALPLTQEDGFFDLKEQIPGDEGGKTRLKKEFCAFANTRGGLIYFGVRNDKNVVGVVKNDTEFTTRLGQIITAHIFPPTIRWELYECIPLEDAAQCVYVVRVFESLYVQKPHVFYKEGEGMTIALREPGSIRHITDGSEIRRIFLRDDAYYPEYNIHVVKILEDLKGKITPGFSLIEMTILQGAKSHMRSSGIEGDAEMLASLEEIESGVSDCNRSFFAGAAEGGVVNNQAEKEALGRKIDNFLIGYNRKQI